MKTKVKTLAFSLEEDHIQLIRLLKFLNIAENGAHAKWLVDEGLVNLNGSLEYRKRAKLKKGDRVEVEGFLIQIS